MQNSNQEQSLVPVLASMTRILVILALFMPLVVTTTTLFPYVVGKAVFSRVLIEMAVILWLPLIILSKEHRPPKSTVVAAFVIYLAVSIVSSMTGVSMNSSLWSTYERMQGLLDLSHWIIFMLIVISVFKNIFQWKIFLSCNLLVSVLVCCMGIMEYLGFSSILPNFISKPGAGRVESTLGNSAYLGTYCLVNTFVAAALISLNAGKLLVRNSYQPKGSRNRPSRRRGVRRKDRNEQLVRQKNLLTLASTTFWTIAIFLNITVLSLTGTRGAMIGLGSSLIFASIVYSFSGKNLLVKKGSLFLIALAMLMVIAFFSYRDSEFVKSNIPSSSLAGRFVQLDINDASVVSRWHTWRAGLRAALDKPIFGWGPENFLIAWGRYFDEPDEIQERFDQAHNKIIEELTTKGITGLLSYLSIWTLTAFYLVKVLKKGIATGFIVAISSALFAYFIQNLFLFDTLTTYSQFIILISLVVCMSQTSWTFDEQGNEIVKEKYCSKIKVWKNLKIARLTTVYFCFAIVAPLMIVLIYWINIGAYSGAQHTAIVADRNTPWPERVHSFESAIDKAPGLANYTRLFMIDSIGRLWGRMPSDVKKQTIEFMNHELEESIRQEPESWRLYFSWARFYLLSAAEDPASLQKANKFVQKLEEIAPGTREAIRAREMSDYVNRQLEVSPAK